jgi:hypothetical protein
VIKYTPSKQILHTLRQIRKAPYVLNKEYNFIRSCLPAGSDYTMHSTFSRWFDGSVFFSPVPLREVPLHGVLFPVSLFDAEEISA